MLVSHELLVDGLPREEAVRDPVVEDGVERRRAAGGVEQREGPHLGLPVDDQLRGFSVDAQEDDLVGLGLEEAAHQLVGDAIHKVLHETSACVLLMSS